MLLLLLRTFFVAEYTPLRSCRFLPGIHKILKIIKFKQWTKWSNLFLVKNELIHFELIVQTWFHCCFLMTPYITRIWIWMNANYMFLLIMWMIDSNWNGLEIFRLLLLLLLLSIELLWNFLKFHIKSIKFDKILIWQDEVDGMLIVCTTLINWKYFGNLWKIKKMITKTTKTQK